MTDTRSRLLARDASATGDRAALARLNIQRVRAGTVPCQHSGIGEKGALHAVVFCAEDVTAVCLFACRGAHQRTGEPLWGVPTCKTCLRVLSAGRAVMPDELRVANGQSEPKSKEKEREWRRRRGRYVAGSWPL